MLTSFIWLAAALALLAYAIIIYNGLVNLKHAIGKAWSNIDVLLKQRHDELPKLVETCRQHMQFERSALEQVMAARAGSQQAREAGDIRAVGQAESRLRGGLGSIIATVEAYPELKADHSIQQLLGRITGLENAIADRREFYNETVNLNNVRIEQFPDVLIARLFTFRAAELLQFSADETRDVDLHALFSR
ncbi:LemA family protein [Solimonas sp. C16B3]|uniref:LemA family protein n=1 Tax=Solimonas marina TaxID=2714601 RepID=A0A970B923_9GAMM|nr:LemA family protein [Solimonas marina]NKF22869.1 LemA family protein [Solimonas marina]